MKIKSSVLSDEGNLDIDKSLYGPKRSLLSFTVWLGDSYVSLFLL